MANNTKKQAINQDKSKPQANSQTNSQLPNRYDSKAVEPKWQKFWEKNNIYKFNEQTKKQIFSIDTPPPTISGKMHLGHAFSYSQQDFVARFKRMSGHAVFYPFGTDDNGLATEKIVQKHKKLNLRKLSREDAIKTCLEFLKEERPKFIQDWKNIGMSCDFNAIYSTIDDYSRKISQKSFLDLAKKGLVYRKKGPIMWDRVFQTAIAQAELEDKKRNSYLNYIKAKFVDEKQHPDTYVIYATTRPELLYACVGMSIEAKGKYVKLKVNLNQNGAKTQEFWIVGQSTYEEKFKDFDYELVEEISGEDLQGLQVQIPFSNLKVALGDDISVKADFGTGIVYYCTYGGLDCVEWMARHPKITPIDILGKDGRLKDNCEKYAGMLCEEARKEIIKDLESKNFCIKKEQIQQIVNVGERSGVEVEYIVSEQWFVKYLDRKEEFLADSNTLNWFPPHMKHRLDNWIKGLNWDWGFSRQRHFGIPIPVWYDDKNQIHYAKESQLPVDPTSTRPLGVDKKLKLTAETDVFDTWFTSSSSPFLATSLIKDEATRNKAFPMSLRPQAHDIINFWLFYTLAKTKLLHKKIPWKDVTVSGFVLDPKGNKMSKSKGNVVAPQDVIEKFSADAIRFWAATSKLGEDLPYQEKDVKTGQKFVNKLWNASKFSFMHLEDYDFKQGFEMPSQAFDKWLLLKLQKTITATTALFNKYESAKAKSQLELFFWQNFCDQYLEIVKDRLYNPTERGIAHRSSAQKTLFLALFSTIKMISPITPYITEEIYQLFFKDKLLDAKQSVHLTSWPKADLGLDKIDPKFEEIGDIGIDIINAVRKYKSEQKLSLKQELSKITLASDNVVDLQSKIDLIAKDLAAVLHFGQIEICSKSELKSPIETEHFKIKIAIEK